jgi:hypothetical protein
VVAHAVQLNGLLGSHFGRHRTIELWQKVTFESIDWSNLVRKSLLQMIKME